MNEREPVSEADDFRWQAFYQRSTDPLFLLNRQRRLLFVNRAWEALTGLSAAQARGLICRRQQPAAAGDSLEDLLAHALCPPPEVLRGAIGRARRLLPALLEGHTPRWWDVEFLPMREGKSIRGIFGRITPITSPTAPDATPLPEKLVALRERAAERYGMELLSSESPAIRRLAQQVRIAAFLPTPAVIVGEAGCGKETVARIIHYQGRQRERTFIALDCARLPSGAIAEILLTHSATTHCSLAGTVYLSEPQRLPRDLQHDLSIVIASGNSPRLLAGLCGDPDEETRAGRLLPELWCALSAFILQAPPLRQRLVDLALIVEQFLARASFLTEKPVTELTSAAWELVRGYSWPGNLRELFRVLLSACPVAVNGRIDVEHLPVSLRQAQRLAAAPAPGAEKPLPLDTLLEETERRVIQLALRRAKGKKRRAAELLGITRQRLLRRMEVLGLIEGEPLTELELEEDE